jgi:hypothetical protein
MKKTITLACVLTLFLASCSKKEVVGPAGPSGPAGTNGTNGTDGTDGNANVLSTSIIAASNWKQESTYLYSTEIPYSSITQSIIDKGTVLVYQQIGTSEWVVLPYTLGKKLTTFSFTNGKVTLVNYNTDLSANTNPGSVNYRITVISSN